MKDRKIEMSIVITVFMLIFSIIGGTVSYASKIDSNKLEISALGFYADEVAIESAVCGDGFQEELNKLGVETDEVYKVENELISKEVLKELQSYLDMNVISVDTEDERKNYVGEEDVMLNLTTAKEVIYSKTTAENDAKYIDKYTVENAKSIYRDKIESIIRILGLDGYTVDDFVSYVSEYETYTDADGVEHKEICGIALECQLAVDTNLECEGVIPFVRLDIDANGEINNLFYLDKSVEKIDSGYELKNMEEIISDIENDNNVLTENVTGTGEEVVLEDVEMKMYSEGAGTAQKYMIPYYYITGNENGNEVEIIMPAIKNEYLKVN